MFEGEHKSNVVSMSSDDLYPGGSVSGYMRDWKDKLEENSRRRRRLHTTKHEAPIKKSMESRQRANAGHESVFPSRVLQEGSRTEVYSKWTGVNVKGYDLGVQVSAGRYGGVKRSAGEQESQVLKY